jgi:hypothetical protein
MPGSSRCTGAERRASGSTAVRGLAARVDVPRRSSPALRRRHTRLAARRAADPAPVAGTRFGLGRCSAQAASLVTSVECARFGRLLRYRTGASSGARPRSAVLLDSSASGALTSGSPTSEDPHSRMTNWCPLRLSRTKQVPSGACSTETVPCSPYRNVMVSPCRWIEASTTTRSVRGEDETL